MVYLSQRLIVYVASFVVGVFHCMLLVLVIVDILLVSRPCHLAEFSLFVSVVIKYITKFSWIP